MPVLLKISQMEQETQVAGHNQAIQIYLQEKSKANGKWPPKLTIAQV